MAVSPPGSGGPKTGQEIQAILPLFGRPRRLSENVDLSVIGESADMVAIIKFGQALRSLLQSRTKCERSRSLCGAKKRGYPLFMPFEIPFSLLQGIPHPSEVLLRSS